MQSRSTYRHAYTRSYRMIAVVLCVLYICGPLKDLVGYGLHQLAHSLERPAAIIGHEITQAHTSWEHTLASGKHEHSLLNAVSSFFEAMEQHDPLREIPPSITFLDKHVAKDADSVSDTGVHSIFYPELRGVALAQGFALIEIPPPLS